MHQGPEQRDDSDTDSDTDSDSTDSDSKIDQCDVQPCQPCQSCLRRIDKVDYKSEICINCYTDLIKIYTNACAWCGYATKKDKHKYACSRGKNEYTIMCGDCFNTVGFCKKCGVLGDLIPNEGTHNEIENDNNILGLLEEYPNMREAVSCMCYSCAETHITRSVSENDGPSTPYYTY